jgi:hypothetical protein
MRGKTLYIEGKVVAAPLGRLLRPVAPNPISV